MDLGERLSMIDAGISRLEARVASEEEPPLADVLEPAIGLVGETMRAYIDAAGEKLPPPPDADVLEIWNRLVKGDPTWNAVRDNCRELVYYRNCIAAGRTDSLPAVPARMTVRLARHIYLYVRVRCAREGRVAA
jgi:hypothetical protein